MLGGAGFLNHQQSPPTTLPKLNRPTWLWWRDSWIKIHQSWSVFFRYIPWNWQILASENMSKLHFKKERTFLQPSFFRGDTPIFFLWGGFQTTHVGEEKRVVISNPSPFLRVGGILEKLTDGFIWSFLGWLCKKRPSNPPQKNTGGWFHQPKTVGSVVFLFKESFGLFFFGLPETNIFFGSWKSNQLEIVGRRFISFWGNFWPIFRGRLLLVLENFHTRCAPTSYKWDHTPYK